MVGGTRVIWTLAAEVRFVMRKPFLVCYDVRDDKRLRSTAKILEGYGRRIQYSVFYCYISSRSLEKMRWELGKILEKEDDLIVVSLCEVCARKLSAMNPRKLWEDESESCIVI